METIPNPDSSDILLAIANYVNIYMLLEKERRHGIRSLAIPPILMYHMWNTLVLSYFKNGIGFDGDVTLKEESLKV